jgi:DNA polymerase III epsilon subunit-like protein
MNTINRHTFHVTRITRAQTKYGNSMYTCETQEGKTVYAFTHDDPNKDTFMLFREYYTELGKLTLGDCVNWTQTPIQIECIQTPDGKYYNLVRVQPRPTGAAPDPLLHINLVPYREAAIHWAQLMTSDAANPLYFDVETTGFGSQAGICQLSLLDSTGQILFHEYIMPNNPQQLLIKNGKDNKSVSDVNGITPELLTLYKALPFSAYYETLYSLMEGMAVIAYNIGFDTRMLELECIRMNRMPLFTIDYDLMKYARWCYGDYNPAKETFAPLSMQEAVKRAGLDQVQTHSALDDCALMVKLVQAMAGLEADAT